jgi:hypothetical protein
MQLLFSREELRVLAQVLEELALSREGTQKRTSYELLDRVIAHDLRLASDELENLQDLLAVYQSDLRQRIAAADAITKLLLQDKAKMLESVMDKVTEACAMV